MINTQSNSSAPTEWSVAHYELKDRLRSLIIQHMIEPRFMAEVTEKNNEVKFLPDVSNEILKLSEIIQNRWKEKAIKHFEPQVKIYFDSDN